MMNAVIFMNNLEQDVQKQKVLNMVDVQFQFIKGLNLKQFYELFQEILKFQH